MTRMGSASSQPLAAVYALTGFGVGTLVAAVVAELGRVGESGLASLDQVDPSSVRWLRNRGR